MQTNRGRAGIVMFAATIVVAAGLGRAQEAAQPDPRAAIEADFDTQLRQLERQRITRLAELAARQEPAEAAQTYESLFRHAITENTFGAAGPAAEKALADKNIPSRVVFLAGIVHIMDLVDRNEYARSVDSLLALTDARPRDNQAGAAAPLPVHAMVSILELYYQRLVQADQFDLARKAFQRIREVSASEAVKDLATVRLKELDMIGKPAPALAGTDIDSQPVSLAELRGQVVLVVFWATWCVPCADQVQVLDEVERTYRDQGFRILGVNLDALSEGGRDVSLVQPAVRRFLVEHNVRWPNLISPAGEKNLASPFGVTDIPASVLIGRDGTVIHLDLTQSNLSKVVARSLANPR